MEWILAGHRVLGSATALALLASLAACGSDDDDSSPGPAAETVADRTDDFEALEEKYDATLGVYAFDTGTGEELAHNPDERFGYASTFKAFLAGVFLRDYSFEELEEVVHFTEDDLEAHAPVAEENVETGMTLLEMSEAAVRFSDNTAAFLLLDELGGMDQMNEILAELGDDVTQMNQYRENFGVFTEGETSDTTTPRAFAENLDAFTFGDVLDNDKRDVFIEWLQTNETGGELVEAGIPDDWMIGGKTGMGANHGIRNNIVVMWPPESNPIVAAVMTKGPEDDSEPQDELLAEAGAIISDEMGSE